MVVYPTTGLAKKYAGPVRLYLNYKARDGEYEYLPQAVAPSLQLAGTTEPYSAMLTRKDLQALGTKALYSGLHRTAHITKLVEVPMEQKDLILHHHGLDEQGENRPDSTASRIEDKRTWLVRNLAYYTGVVPSTRFECWTAITARICARGAGPRTSNNIPRSYPEQTVD